MGFPKQEYWSLLPWFPSPRDLPDPGIKPASPKLAGRFFTTEPPGKLHSWIEWWVNRWSFYASYLHICCFTCIRYYKIAKEIIFKAELVFHFLSSPSPDFTPAVASCPQGSQELSLLKIRNQSLVVLGIRGEIQRGRLTCLPKEISKTHTHTATWPSSHKPPILWKEALCS